MVANYGIVFYSVLSATLLLLIISGVKGALMEVKAPPPKCLEADLRECSVTAESLIKDPGLIFPDKPSTLDRVCNTWNKLTSCIDNYTTKCYTLVEKRKFDRHFKESITAMTTVCTDQSYRNDYLKYAPCVRRVTTDGEHCGFPYQILIDQISNPEVTMKQLCCSRTKFKNCILTKTKEVCEEGGESSPTGEKVPIGSAKPMNITMFAQQVVDKSLAFIAQQCAEIRSSKNDCETGSAVLLRPNSKGPLVSEENFQADASDPSRHPVLSPAIPAIPANTKFQTGQKVNGNLWNTNSVASLEVKQPVDFNLPGSAGSKKESFQAAASLGLVPKGTESKTIDKPQNDRLKLSGNAGLAGKEGGENAGNFILPSSVLQFFMTLGFARLIVL